MFKHGILSVAALLLLALQIHGQEQSATPTAASPQAVCKFLNERMQSALPQIPTLCAGTQDTSGYYEINVFSPKDVLEGDMRRAWSSALFQTLEATVSEKSLKGACSAKEPTCVVNVTDSFMAKEGIRYRLILDMREVSGVLAEVGAFHGTEFSDPWYFAWWDTLMISKVSEHPQSKASAEWIVKKACEDYLQAGALTFRVRNKPPPSCTVLLSTDKALYIEIDFSDFLRALVSDNAADLPKTFGKAFDGSL